MRVVVCGGRDYDNRDLVFLVLAVLQPQVVIEGGASGADALARAWTKEVGNRLITIEADWETHGKAAGPIRNGWMLDRAPDLVLAFPGGKGTENCIAQARARGIPVLRVEDSET